MIKQKDLVKGYSKCKQIYNPIHRIKKAQNLLTQTD